MTDREDALERENAALRERISMLSAASLRIATSLDLLTVLQQVVDSARALTGAGCGVITTSDVVERPQEFVSSGFTAQEHRQMVEWSDGTRLFEHMCTLPGALRLTDLPGYVRALGIAPQSFLSPTCLVMPMRHRGVHAGTFFLGGKEGGEEFSAEDEEVLVLFATQAAAAIANARAFREERRARADLEALVDTSPVGVAVFDATTGHPVSFNREVSRIVESLGLPGQRPEKLLEVMTCRFADGRELAFTELPMTQVLGGAETVRAEEIEISTPDGHSVTALLNVTPLRTETGAVDSVVVTLQDLAPLRELERQRVEFLGLVSHELRAPLTSIKGSTATLLATGWELDPAELREFHRIIDAQADHMRGLISDLLDAGRIDAGTLSVSPESSSVSELVERARTTFLSGGGRHPVLIDLSPELPRAMADRRRIVQVLNNLLLNAARHAPESSPIRVEAVRDGAEVAIAVSDRGRGVAPGRLRHLFSRYGGGTEQGVAGPGGPGTGAGLGLSICKGLVEAHGGRIRAESAGPGQGLRIVFTLPVAEEAGARSGAAAGEAPLGPVRVLVVDDDPHTLRYVREVLSEAGYAVVLTGDPEELSRLLAAERPELVLLDLMLPGVDGIELMQRLPALADLPVIFISGYGRDETIAKALEAGAADYIVKPFAPTELTARIRAALRRRAAPEPFVLGDLAIDYDRRRVMVAGKAVNLTATEFDLLRALSLEAGRVVTYDTLLRRVWQGRGNQKAVHAIAKILRRKLGDDAADPAWLFNERGVGYRMPAPGSS